MVRQYSGENLPLPEHKHIEIIDQDGLREVDNSVTLTFKVSECHFKRITSVPATKINCKSIVSTLRRNSFIHESVQNQN